MQEFLACLTRGIDVYFKTELKEEGCVHFEIRKYDHLNFRYIEKMEERYADSGQFTSLPYVGHLSCITLDRHQISE